MDEWGQLTSMPRSVVVRVFLPAHRKGSKKTIHKYFWCSFLCAELCNAKGNIGLLQTHRTPPPPSVTQPTLKLMLTMPLSSEIWLHNNTKFEGQLLEW
ncbi:hypothetical protein MTR_6g017040 [Medicago truncatula]|uniref:Uncharacterized protein n=1 Tax=Medicago truncatula TaxID=3880 RepID=G7ZZ66_MEDTR|nr:hypothetical protein MTR_6g017040 [Medicago truncatula]